MKAIEELKKLEEKGQYCISLRRASKLLGVHMNTLKMWIWKGKIEARIYEENGRTRYFIDTKSLRKFLEEELF
ncbi:hypothetical protein JCM9492_11210 [Aquifex pyrophilus]